MKYLLVTATLSGLLLSGCYHKPPNAIPDECDEQCQKYAAERDLFATLIPTSIVGSFILGFAVGLLAGEAQE